MSRIDHNKEMNRYGYIKVAAAVPAVKVADCRFNAEHTIAMMRRAAARGVRAVVFPELGVTAYTCGDLFLQSKLLDAAREALDTIVEASRTIPVTAVVGAPLRYGNAIYNCAVAIACGEYLCAVPKSYIPNYAEFYEARWFASGIGIAESCIRLGGRDVPFGTDAAFSVDGVRFGMEICEDLWVPVPPSSHLAAGGAEVIFNLSASPEVIGKHKYLTSLVRQQSARATAAYVYVSSGFGESSTDLVFAGNGLVAENGTMLAEGERFSAGEQMVVADVDVEFLRSERLRRNTYADAGATALRITDATLPAAAEAPFDRRVNPMPFVPHEQGDRHSRCEEIFSIQSLGLAQRLAHTGCRCAVVGISGGLDSALALLVTLRAFDRLGLDRRGIIGVTMPGFGTTGRTYRNAVTLVEESGATLREISIAEACRQHFADIGLPDSDRSVTYENAQARERTQILMDVANMHGGIVIGTGDLSELALGWATYNGDHMSMYGVNCSVPKTLVRHMVEWAASVEKSDAMRRALEDVAATPVSPELLPADENGDIAQKTEDIVGPYELHDFFLYNFVRQGFSPSKILFLATHAFGERYDRATVVKWLRIFFRRFFSQQFKRSALPDGPKVGSVSLSPRGDWRMPSDASAAEWLRECDALQ